MAENNSRIKTIGILAIIIVGIFAGSYLISNTNSKGYTYSVKTFSSYDELNDFLAEKYEDSNSQYYRGISGMIGSAAEDSKSADGQGTTDYSETNVQVEGVDEPDIVKTDGEYMYVLAGQTLFILRAYPTADAAVLSKITFDDDISVSEIFLKDSYLVVFGSSYNYPILYGRYIEKDEGTGEEITEEIPTEDSWQVSSSVIKIYDISDKQNPSLAKNIEIDGTYFDSRMIGNYVYVVSSEYSYYIFRYDYEDENYSLNVPELTIDSTTEKIPCDQIYYIDSPEPVDSMTHVISINLNDLEVNEKSFLIGVSENMYMSERNIYLVYTDYDYSTSATAEMYYDSYKETTVIHKIKVESGEISYVAKGEAAGRILNQFSMDENNGFFRIATTQGDSWTEENPLKNNIFIFNENLEQVSAIEDIAPGERIYSSRFMGDKAYLVTFKNTDPFYTIDVSDPYNPQIIGYLKIPGFSTYLHPYDETHIIGIGKETTGSENSDFAWYLGLKIALFDVSIFDKPVEVDRIVIGDRGTDSPALYDHKAFLFDREKELLVIPVSLYEIPQETKDDYDDFPGPDYGEFTYQGAYVLNLNLDGFEERGRITHMSDTEQEENENWWYWQESLSYISRSLYIEDVLYTISSKAVKLNNIDDLSEIKVVELT